MQTSQKVEDTESTPESGRFTTWLLKHTVPIVGVLAAAGVVTSLQVFRISSEVKDEAALHHAASVAGVIREFRTLYTSEVVNRVRDHGISAIRDYRDVDGAIPLPVTMSLELGRDRRGRVRGPDAALQPVSVPDANRRRAA